MKKTALALATALAVAAAVLLLSSPGGEAPTTVTVTTTATKTETQTVTQTYTVFKTPPRVVVLYPNDTAPLSQLYADVAIANVTDPISFIQAIYYSRAVGAKIDVIVAYWGPPMALLAKNGVLKPLPDLPYAVRYNGTPYGVPLSVEPPVLICNKTHVAQPPQGIEELLEFVKSGGKLALYIDMVTNSPFIYSVGGSYYNGTPNALLGERTLQGLRILAELYKHAVGNPHDPEGQFQLFLRGEAHCIIDGPWNLPRLDPARISASIFYNKTLAYVKAAYALTDLGVDFVKSLASGAALWKYGYISPYERGGDPVIQTLRKAATLAEPPPIHSPGIVDPLTGAVYRVLTETAKGNDPAQAAAQALQQLST